MIIQFHRRFQKQLIKLNKNDKARVIKIIEIFKVDFNARCLKNHALKGRLKNKRAISVGPDMRIIFKEYKKYTLVIFLDLGKHNNIYK